MLVIALFTSLAGPAWADEPVAVEEPLLLAIELPVRAHEIRQHGVEETEIRAAVEAMRVRQVPAAEAAETLEVAESAVEEHGPVDGFGDFVQSKLDEGLRGQDLAAAIRGEHEARGQKPETAGKPEGVGKPETAGTTGKPETAGKPDTKGRPEAAGKPETAGKPDGAGHGAKHTQ